MKFTLPRLVLVLLFLFTDACSRSFEFHIWPLLGLIFMPLTTMAYMAAMVYNQHHVGGIYLLFIIIAVIVDVASWEDS